MKLFVGNKKEHCNASTKHFSIMDFDADLNVTGFATHTMSEARYSHDMIQWGFAWHGGDLYAPHSTDGVQKYNRNLNKLTNYLGPDFSCAAMKPEKFLNPGDQFNRSHQSITIKDKIYICDSGHCLIKVFDTKTGEITAHDPVKGNPNKNWPNSINYIDDRLHIIYHNHGESDLYSMDLDFENVEITEGIGQLAHNVWKMNDCLWTCSSREGVIRSIPYGRHENIEVGGFPRGIAMTEKYLIVGISDVRTSYTDALPRDRWLSESCALVFLSLDDYSVSKVLDMTEHDNTLQLFELRMMDEPDQAIYTDEGNEIFSLGGHVEYAAR